jgi:hypothetical protein
MFAAGGAMAYTAKPIYVKGYAAGSFINTTFSFDGGTDTLATYIGADTLGGEGVTQDVAEFYDSGDSCTATDGTVGEVFDLYEQVGVDTYVDGGQVYNFSDTGSECISLTTGVFNGSGSYIIFGGSGKFVGASGIIEAYFSGQELAVPSSPGSGFFGSAQASYYGSVTP